MGNPKIGLVLASVPTYSETFLDSKIAGLRSAGQDVMLLVARSRVSSYRGVPVRSAIGDGRLRSRMVAQRLRNSIGSAPRNFGRVVFGLFLVAVFRRKNKGFF